MPTTNAPGPMPPRDAKNDVHGCGHSENRWRDEISDTVASDALFLVPDSSFLLAESDAKPVLLCPAPDRWPFLLFTLLLTLVVWMTQALRLLDLVINRGQSAGIFAYPPC